MGKEKIIFILVYYAVYKQLKTFYYLFNKDVLQYLTLDKIDL